MLSRLVGVSRAPVISGRDGSRGGEAKLLVVEGDVTVDGEVETRRGRKIRAGQRVSCADVTVEVVG